MIMDLVSSSSRAELMGFPEFAENAWRLLRVQFLSVDRSPRSGQKLFVVSDRFEPNCRLRAEQKTIGLIWLSAAANPTEGPSSRSHLRRGVRKLRASASRCEAGLEPGPSRSPEHRAPFAVHLTGYVEADPFQPAARQANADIGANHAKPDLRTAVRPFDGVKQEELIFRRLHPLAVSEFQ